MCLYCCCCCCCDVTAILLLLLVTHAPSGPNLTHIAILNTDRCKPKKCRQECKKSCPVVRMGKDVVFLLYREMVLAGCPCCVVSSESKCTHTSYPLPPSHPTTQQVNCVLRWIQAPKLPFFPKSCALVAVFA